MQDIVNRFKKILITFEFPLKPLSWNIAGILKNHNCFYKFDVREDYLLNNNKKGKETKTDTEADKIVFENKYDWIILDLPEINKFIIKNNLKEIYVEEVLRKLEWNIVIKK